MESNRKFKTIASLSSSASKSFKNFQNLNMCVIFLVITILTGHISKAQPQNNIVDTEPSEAVSLEGQKVSLLCRYGLPINYCRIKIPGEKVLNLLPDWDQPGFQYYGSGLQSGQCGVTIERVNARNHGPVECNLGIRSGEATGKINLIVALSPNTPEIEVLTPSRGNEFNVDQIFKAKCSVKDGRPAANITWFLDNEPIYEGLGRREEIKTVDINNSTLITTIQEIQRVLTAQDNGKILTCRASHIADQDSRPKEKKLQLLVKYPPQPLPDIKVYGLTLGTTAVINVTIEANPRPRTDWTVDGVVITQGGQIGKYEAYEPYDLGNGLYNVTLNVAGLTIEDTMKDYILRASNDIGLREYTVRISSSNTPPASGLDIGAIVGIVIAVIILIVIVLLILFARATGRWCFAGKSSKSATSETSDTESTEVKVTKFRKLPKFEAIFMKKSEKSKNGTTGGANGKNNNANEDQQQTEDQQRLAGIDKTPSSKDNDGNDNESKEDKQLVYAELVLKPSDESKKPLTQGLQQQTPKNASTEYAEIVYVKKGQPQDEKKSLTKNQSK